jgi:hypothetical protein
MKFLQDLRWPKDRPGLLVRLGAFLMLMAAVLVILAAAGKARGQVAAPGYQQGAKLAVGGTGFSEFLQYGQRRMLGASAFVDGDTKRRIGIEAEGRWLEYHQTANVHAETYSVGGRYHFDFGQFQPYAKGLVGIGNFNFPYNYATQRTLVVTAGAGVDFHWTHRIYLRAADFEYQDWPEFEYGAMSTMSVSAGLRVKIF